MAENVTIELSQTTCWCGTPFMVPATLLKSAHNDGHTIYCPHGHTLCWKDTEKDKLRRERDGLKQQTARLEDEKRDAWATANAQYARAVKAEAATKRLKKRTAAGTCPCCQRTFSNMSTHMRTQHPAFVAEQVVVPIKKTA